MLNRHNVLANKLIGAATQAAGGSDARLRLDNQHLIRQKATCKPCTSLNRACGMVWYSSRGRFEL
jgi:hypothetical protein